MWAMRLSAILAGVLAFACATPRAMPGLVGEWHGQGDNARGSVLRFLPDGRLAWSIGSGAEAFTVDANYTVAGATLDITNFSAGPLRGDALYCIYEFTSADEIRMDCERGELDDPSVRPAGYDAKQTQTFRRATPSP